MHIQWGKLYNDYVSLTNPGLFLIWTLGTKLVKMQSKYNSKCNLNTRTKLISKGHLQNCIASLCHGPNVIIVYTEWMLPHIAAMLWFKSKRTLNRRLPRHISVQFGCDCCVICTCQSLEWCCRQIHLRVCTHVECHYIPRQGRRWRTSI